MTLPWSDPASDPVGDIFDWIEIYKVHDMWGTNRCGVCEEPLKLTDTDVAEMVDPETQKHVIGHWLCGQGKGMVLA